MTYEPGARFNVEELPLGKTAVSEMPRVDGRIMLVATENVPVGERTWIARLFNTAHAEQLPLVQLGRLLTAAEVDQMLAQLNLPRQ